MSVNKGLDPIINKNYISHYTDWESIKEKLPMYELAKFDKYICSNLSKTNSSIIVEIAKMLNLKAKIISDHPTESKSTQRLIDICKRHGAKKYLSGSSGKNYIDLKLFKLNEIEVVFQDQDKSKPILEVLYV